MTAEIDVTLACPAWTEALPDAEDRCRRLAAAALGAGDFAAHEAVELSLVLADDATVHELNRVWRAQDKPTNVLSFAALDDDGAPTVPGAPLMLGDVVLAYQTCAVEAVEQGKPLADHLAHLVVHGVLHLLGYDHEGDDAEAEEMEGMETAILAAFGIPDPYSPQPLSPAEGGRRGP